MQDFRHRGARHINTLLGQSAFMEVLPCVFAVRQIHVRNNIHDSAVRFLRQTFILTTVSCFHMKDRYVKALGRYRGQTGIGIAKNQQGIRSDTAHQFIGTGDNIPDGLAQIAARRIHIDFRSVQL